MIKLSHSAVTKYTDCPKSYRYHYLDKLRPLVQSSALLYGTAIDRAAEHYSLTKNFTETIELFNRTWQTQEINGKEEDLRFLLNFTYSDKDLDVDLLKEEDWKLLERFVDDPDYGDIQKELQDCIIEKNSIGYAKLDDKTKETFNYANWLCLKRKGYYMLKEFKKVFDENVEEVIGSQIKIDLENENGDSVTGFIDFVVKWKGIENPVILDLKTAGREYEDDAVLKSPQLATYLFSVGAKYNTKTCGFLVLNKNINKNKTKKCSVCGKNGTGGRFKTCDAEIAGNRCNGTWDEKFYPMAKSQILINEISDVLVENVIDNFTEITKAVKAEIFPRNWSSCIKYGSIKCPYYSKCHHGLEEGIFKKE